MLAAYWILQVPRRNEDETQRPRPSDRGRRPCERRRRRRPLFNTCRGRFLLFDECVNLSARQQRLPRASRRPDARRLAAAIRSPTGPRTGASAKPHGRSEIPAPTPARYSHRDAPADHSARTAFVPSIKNLDSPNCQFACFGKGYQAAARIPWISPNERAPSPGRGPRAGGQCADRLGAGGHGYRPTHAPTCFYSHGSRDITPLRATPC
jgi:hypothetical protein